MRLILLLLILFSSISETHSFTITAEPPDKLSKLTFGTTGWSIYIDGDIDKASAIKLSRELPKYYKTGVFIYFNSSGGDPIAAMEIGRIIRKFSGAHVNIGKKNFLTNQIDSGICLSACTLAYLGGTYRFIDKNSIYGVHLTKLKNDIASKKYDFALGQILNSEIAIYLNEMGINQNLMQYIVSTSNIKIIPFDILKELQVINEGNFKSIWNINQVDNMFYLAGEQESTRGLGKFIFTCIDKKLQLTTGYKYGETFKEEGNEFSTHSLYIDKQIYYLRDPNESDVENLMLFNSFHDFDKNLAKIMATSNSITYQMQKYKESILFVGFEINISDKDRPKVLNFIENCK
ncbi:hypothetical protein MCECIE61_00639 [Candidatus Methylopumilus planktonicus]|uniref:hypothetical protein n=1 Tax=Candidatus Methylopumilus planktonicus TaxID=1581557 RepID=UPI003BEEE63E